MNLMSDAYHQLLDAAIHHLQDLKARGVHFVSVSPQALDDLGHCRPKTVRSAPAPVAKPGPVEKHEDGGRLTEDGGRTAEGGLISPEGKAAAYAELRQRALACVKCSN